MRETERKCRKDLLGWFRASPLLKYVIKEAVCKTLERELANRDVMGKERSRALATAVKQKRLCSLVQALNTSSRKCICVCVLRVWLANGESDALTLKAL